MASQQGLPPHQRYLINHAGNEEQKEKDINGKKKARADEVDKLARGALPVNEKAQRHLLAAQTLQRVSRSGGRTISEPDSGRVTPEASQPAPLPTPPISPVTSRTPTETASVAPLESAMEFQEIEHLHASLQNHQGQIRSLTLRLEETQREVRDLRNERQKASKEYLSAVRGDAEEEIKKYREREERLVKMVEEREQMIAGYEKKIDDGREREKELRGRLIEAERMAAEREEGLRKMEKSDGDGPRAGVASEEKGKSKERGGKRDGARAGRADWEFRRRKGGKETSFGAMSQILFKPGMHLG